MYLGLNTHRRCTIHEIAVTYGISENHLMKLIHQLGQDGFVTTTRGKNGGVALDRPASQINIGEVIRTTEGNFHLVECFNSKKVGSCPIEGPCALPHILDLALHAFFEVLDQHTLEDLLKRERALKRRLAISR